MKWQRNYERKNGTHLVRKFVVPIVLVVSVEKVIEKLRQRKQVAFIAPHYSPFMIQLNLGQQM